MGYSDSKYENITQSVDMDIAGDGFFAGYSAVYPIGLIESDSLAINFGFSYLDLNSQIYLFNNSVSDEDLSLFLPRFGFQGKFSNPLGLSGDGFWSIGVISDLSGSDETELKVQNPELEKGFYAKGFLAIVEPLQLLV